jgi:hypothetical protein
MQILILFHAELVLLCGLHPFPWNFTGPVSVADQQFFIGCGLKVVKLFFPASSLPIDYLDPGNFGLFRVVAI